MASRLPNLYNLPSRRRGKVNEKLQKKYKSEAKQMTFKEKLVRLRKIKGLTQDEFASAVGVSRQAVYKWESGQSYPEVAKLLEIKILFNISIDDLLDENYVVELPEKKKKKRAPKAEAKVAQEAPAPALPEEKEEEAQPVKEEEPAHAEQAYTADEPEKKKVGFFGRIFGRK